MHKRYIVSLSILFILSLLFTSVSPFAAEVHAASSTGDVIAVAPGTHQSLALKKDGTVWARGWNAAGEQYGGDPEKNKLMQVNGLNDIIAISAGAHYMALKQDGSVWAWGGNYYGEVGDGTNEPRLSPVSVKGLTDVTAVSAGQSYSLAAKKDGTVWAWGNNQFGNLGDGTKNSKNKPVQVNGLTDVVAVSAGTFHSLALRKDGTVWAWGWNSSGQLGDGTQADKYTAVPVKGLSDVAAVSVGDTYSIAVKKDGTVWAWGHNGLGQLGDGTINMKLLPAQVSDLDNIVSVAAGGNHAIALRNDGTVWAWGENGAGQVGDGTTKDKNRPIPVTGLTDAAFVSAGAQYTMALKKDGTAWGWGDNSYNQLGGPIPGLIKTAVQVEWNPQLEAAQPAVKETAAAGSNEAIAVDAGGVHSLAIKKDGTVWSWGYNLYGELGRVSEGMDGTTPAQVPKLADAVAVSGGDFHSAALLRNGSVWRWGDNGEGIFGLKTVDTKRMPTYIQRLEAKAVSAGGTHYLAIDTNGEVWGWEMNPDGQLGTGDKAYRHGPVPVQGLTDVISVSAGGVHSLALKKDGTVWAWGSNEYGQLGDGTNENRLTPVQVTGLTDVIAISASKNGYAHSVALKKDGTVWVWGENHFGQLGDGTFENKNKPQQVQGLSDVTAISTTAFTLALKKDGTVWTWGQNNEGQLGDGTTENRNRPLQVKGVSDVTAVSAGLFHALVLKKDGTVWSWGSNSNGQLGDGTHKDRYTPMQVNLNPEPAQSQPTADSPAEWAKPEVQQAIRLQLVPETMQNGYADPITRADFCKLTVNFLMAVTHKTIEEIISDKGKAVDRNAFKDTKDTTILAANALGIVGGKGNGTFDPKGEITRQEAAVMLARTAQVLGTDTTAAGAAFADSQAIATWAKEAVAFVSSLADGTNEAAVMGGTGDNQFSPNATYTRQQAFVTLKRLFYVR